MHSYKEEYYFDDIVIERGSCISLDEINVSSSIPWEKQHANTELKPVQHGSNEWFQVVNQVQTTLHNAKIVSLYRIQNKWLWDSYMQSKRRLAVKNKNRINEKRLFHGSGKTPPDKIYRSEKGFDFRFASQGLWGEGAYFAVDAKYSDGYAYVHGGWKQMFLALVLTGESCYHNQDNSLKKPPLKNSNQEENMFADERYDSVRGNTCGSEIYVVYEHDKAYPAYLITYELLS